MRVCIVGAGAVGSLIGGKLALAGAEVSLFARGAHLDAIKRDGLLLIGGGAEEAVVRSFRASDSLALFGPQDLVFVTLKAHQVATVAPQIDALYEEGTTVITVQNGIPWWFFDNQPSKFEGHRLESLDPKGIVHRAIPSERIVGAIAYPAVDRPSPGVVRLINGDRIPVGELDGGRSERASKIAGMLESAGFKSRVLTDIRSHLWVKAWGNLAFNPISALTGATLSEICQHAQSRRLASSMMHEASKIADALEVRTRVTVEQRISGAEAIGHHKTSMLQDLEAGRTLELEALVGAFIELGSLTGVPTPTIEAVYACTSLLAQTKRLQ